MDTRGLCHHDLRHLHLRQQDNWIGGGRTHESKSEMHVLSVERCHDRLFAAKLQEYRSRDLYETKWMENFGKFSVFLRFTRFILTLINTFSRKL